jgi:hypothetical protein
MGKFFKIDFDMEDYMDILPDINEYTKYDEVINYNHQVKGNTDFCIWQQQVIPNSTEYREREAKRLLRTGVFIAIGEEVVWIPPNYYQFLQYFSTAGGSPQFRLKRLKHVYFKIRIRRNPFALGTYTIKNRQDGETTMAMNDSLWEVADGNMDFGQIGMQSKTRDTVKDSCCVICCIVIL